MSISSFFSSYLPTVYADAPQEEEKDQKEEKEDKEENVEEPEDKKENDGEEAEAADEEEEEPEDVHPAIREECQSSTGCAALTKHFQHCQEKVEGGQGFKHEDCVEELFHMMHCVDNCAAPKLFSKLR